MRRNLNDLLSSFIGERAGYYLSVLLVLFLPHMVFMISVFEGGLFARYGRLFFGFVMVCAAAYLVTAISPPLIRNVGRPLIVFVAFYSGCYGWRWRCYH